jgi:1,6-anhydro-N-acetylmuramate kinase
MTATADPPRIVAGAMTGTSLDGIDAAVLAVTGHGLDMQAAFQSHAAGSLGPAKETLARLAGGDTVSASDIAAATQNLSTQTAAVMQHAIGDRAVDLAGVHGQTVLHAPPYSWQVIDAAVIAETLACPVASNMRSGDLAAGGQGAPITPLADWILFRSDVRRAVVNLGGFCNITWLPAAADIEHITGRDVCVCNQLLDAAAADRLGEPWDAGGQHAAATSADPSVSNALRERLTAASDRSLGTGDEMLNWLDEPIARETPTDTLLASMAEAIGSVIGAAAGPQSDEILIAGGGGHHQPLVEAIAGAAGVPAMLSSEVGIPIEAREAACVAVLAALDRDGIPITLPGVTGRSNGTMIGMHWCQPL